MAAAGREEGWLRPNLDKVVLVGVLILLLASAVYLLLRIRTERVEIEQALNRAPVRKNPAEPIGFEERQARSDALVYPYQGAALTDRRLMVGEVRVMCVNPQCLRPIPFHAETCPFCRMDQPPVTEFPDRDGGGIPDEWEVRHQLDPFDPADDRGDADDDSFSNLEEFQADTNPRDPTSLPPPALKLRLARIVRRPFDRVFTARMVTQDEVRFQLNAPSSGRTYFSGLGDEVLGYTIEAHLPDDPAGDTLVLRRDAEELRLVRGRAVTAGGTAALLILLLDGSPYRVVENARLDVRGRIYVVEDIQARAVRIRDVETGEGIDVRQVSRAELEALRERRLSTPAGSAGAVTSSDVRSQRALSFRPWLDK